MKKAWQNRWCKGSHSLPPTSRRMPRQRPSNSSLPKTPLCSVFNAIMMSCGRRYGQFESAVLAVSSPSLLAVRTEWDAEKAWVLKTLVCCQCCFSHKSETQHLGAAVGVVICTPAGPRPASKSWKISYDEGRRNAYVEPYNAFFSYVQSKNFIFFFRFFFCFFNKQNVSIKFVLGNCQQYFFLDDVLSRSIILQIWSHFLNIICKEINCKASSLILQEDTCKITCLRFKVSWKQCILLKRTALNKNASQTLYK